MWLFDGLVGGRSPCACSLHFFVVSEGKLCEGPLWPFSHSSFRVIDPQVLLHDALGIEVKLQAVVQDDETDVLMDVREMSNEYSCDIMGDTWR